MLSFFLNLSSLFLGAIVGSFLNCVIYRLPRGMSLLQPKRSFCPACQRSLSWWENIPLLSWLFLRGRCAGCKAPISWRYPFIEALTALLFWVCYHRLEGGVAIPGALFVSLLIAASFIDLEHLLIPDEITLGGIVLGVICSWIVPELHGVSSCWRGLLFSLGSALSGYLLLWGILELGKKAFGRKHLSWEVPQTLTLLKTEAGFSLSLQEESLLLEEIIPRSSDKIIAEAIWLELAGDEYAPQEIEITSQKISLADRSWSLEEVLPFSAEIKKMTLPREAMGFGDVKFLACIGAFLGMKGLLFSLFAGSFIGALTGGILLLITRGRVGRLIPFGPYLSLGALLWLFLVSQKL